MTLILMRLAALCVAVVIATLVTGCSGSSSDDHADHNRATSEDADAKNYNADDVSFAQNMIPHHLQAIEISAIAQGKSDDRDLRAVANAVLATQTAEVEVFREWLMARNEPEAAGHDDHSGMAMKGMIDQATIDRLQALSGSEFNRLWLETMIAHHEGAIEMSNAEIASGKNPDMIQVAKTVIGEQQPEIDQMKKMLAALGG